MSHVATHCGGVGDLETDEPSEIQITIHNHTRLNYAVALKRWPDESEKSWQKRQAKLERLKHKVYDLACMNGDEWHTHEPSYVHPEP